MRPVLIALALFLSGPAAAEVYRWIDGNGAVHYSNAPPPAGIKAKVVDIDAKPGPDSPDTKDCYTLRCQGERLEQRLARREAAETRYAGQRAAAAPVGYRGLEFRRYVSLRRGMTEGELLSVAGAPDLLTRDWYLNTYTYLPTSADPFVTTITLIGGRVNEIDRARKF